MNIENVDGNELRFKNPERLLVVVIAFMFWGVGLLDLIGHTSRDADIFGLYSLPFFLFILLYTATISIWFTLFFNETALERTTQTFRSIQSNSRLAPAMMVGLAVALWIVFEWDRWTRLPGLQFAVFALILLTIALLLFTGEREPGTQRWRTLLIYAFLALAVIEIIAQAAAYFGALPGTYTLDGNYAPYGRIYYNKEGFRNGYANRFGWTFPDVPLDDENPRTLLVGGSFVEAVQVEAEQQFAPQLAALVNGEPAAENAREFVSFGLSGFGITPFIFPTIVEEMPGIIANDEMIVFWHLRDDFQYDADPVRYEMTPDGAQVLEEHARLRHDLTHYYLHGFTSFQLVETLRSNYLTPKILTAWLTADTRSDSIFSSPIGVVTQRYNLTEPGHAGIRETRLRETWQQRLIMFVVDSSPEQQNALELAFSQLEQAQEAATASGIQLRVVTIPFFPSLFYENNEGATWNSELDPIDLFLPERALVDFGRNHNLPVLPIGQYLLDSGLTANEVQDLFFAEGTGHLTPAGHTLFAEAIHACFYAQTLIYDTCSN